MGGPPGERAVVVSAVSQNQPLKVEIKGFKTLLNLDNMKSAVLQADWFDPEINPKLADFCRHYHLDVVPCRPGKPEHKGKVERGVAYLRNNALKGRRLRSAAEENLCLQHWESSIADKRIHGTTRKQVAACFEEERPHLQPLPSSLFPCFQEARRSVHRDSYVEVEKALYETPDDMGLKVLPPKSGEILLEHHASLRKPFHDDDPQPSHRRMGKLLSDVPAASAILDRLLHHAEVIAITGRSYRVQPSPKPSTTKPNR